MTELPGKPIAVKPRTEFAPGTAGEIPVEVVEDSPVPGNTGTYTAPPEAPRTSRITSPASTQPQVSPDPTLQLERTAPAPAPKPASPESIEKLKRLQRAIIQRNKIEAKKQQRRDRLQQKKEEILIGRHKRYRSGINSAFLDILDLPGDTVSLILNQLISPRGVGEEAKPGPIPSGGFREMSRFIGRHVDSLPDGFVKTFLSGVGFEEPTLDVFGNLGTLEKSPEFQDGRLMGEGLAFTLLAPALASLEVAPTYKMLSRTQLAPLRKRDKIKRFFQSVGELAVRKPVATLLVETTSTGLATYGLRIGKERYPDSLAAQFLMGFTFGSTGTLLPLRTGVGIGKQFGSKFLNAFGSKAAFTNAQKQLQKRLGSQEEIDKALAGLGYIKDGLFASRELREIARSARGTEDVPGFFDLLSPAERTRLQTVVNFQTAFFREKENIELGEFARWRKMHDILVEVGRTPASKVQGSVEEGIRDSLNQIRILLEARLETVAMKLIKRAENLKHSIDPKLANIQAKTLILEEEEIAENSLRVLWRKVDMEVDTPSSAATKTFRKLLDEVREEAGLGLFKLGDEAAGGDLKKFLGHYEILPAQKAVRAKKAVPDTINKKGRPAVRAKKAVPSKKVWRRGKWGATVTLGQQQDLRSRILQVIREERAADAPNMRKISVLQDIAESLLHGMGNARGPSVSSEAHQTALRATRIVKERFADKPIADILRVGRHGEKTPASLTLENIFTGAGKAEAAKGEAIFVRLLKSLEGGSPDAPVELIGAAEQLIKHRVYSQLIKNGDVNVGQAETFLRHHKRLLDLPALQGVRDDIAELIQTGNIAEFRKLKNVQLTKQVNDPKLSMAAFYLEHGPKKTFNEIRQMREPAQVKAAVVDMLTRVKRNPDAKEGLDGHFFLWMVDEASIKQTLNLDTPEILSGGSLRSIWESQNVQAMAKAFLSPERRNMMEKVIHSAETLDMILHAHASRGGTFDLAPNVLIERLLRYAALRFSPLPKGGGGSIAAAQLLSENVRDVFRKRFKDPAVHILYDAFMNKNEDLLKSLFMNIQTSEDAAIVASQVNAWFAAATFATGERAMNDREEDAPLISSPSISLTEGLTSEPPVNVK